MDNQKEEEKQTRKIKDESVKEWRWKWWSNPGKSVSELDKELRWKKKITRNELNPFLGWDFKGNINSIGPDENENQDYHERCACNLIKLWIQDINQPKKILEY